MQVVGHVASERGDDLKRKTLSGAAWIGGAHVAQMLVRLGVTMVLARLLAPADFGLVAVATALLVFCQTLAPLGTPVALLRLRDAGAEESRAAFTITLSMAFPMAAAAIVVAYALEGPMRLPGLGLAMLTLSPAVVVDGLGRLASRSLHKNMNFRPDTIASVVGYLVGYGGIGIALASLGAGWIALCWAEVAAATLSAAYLLWAGRPTIGVNYDMAIWRRLLGFGAASTAANLIGWGASNLPRLLIGAFGSAVALGFYVRASDLSNRFGSLVEKLSTTVLFAAFVQRNDDAPKLAKALSAAASILFVVGLPIAAMLSALAEPLILGLFGCQWQGAVGAFAVLAFVIPTQLLQRIALVMAHSLGRPGSSIKTHSLFLVLALGGATIGVRHGPAGVAVAVLGAGLAGALTAFGLAARLVGLPFSTFWVALLKGAALAVAVFASCGLFLETLSQVPALRQLAMTVPAAAALLVTVWLGGRRWLFSRPAQDLITQALRRVAAASTAHQGA